MDKMKKHKLCFADDQAVLVKDNDHLEHSLLNDLGKEGKCVLEICCFKNTYKGIKITLCEELKINVSKKDSFFFTQRCY